MQQAQRLSSSDICFGFLGLIPSSIVGLCNHGIDLWIHSFDLVYARLQQVYR